MAKLISILALIALSAAIGVGAMWYVYGIPLKSVAALVLFVCFQFAVTIAMQAVVKED